MTDGIRDALLLSLLVASVATVGVALLGGLLGRWLAKHRHTGGDIVDALASLPLFLPPTVP